MASFEALMGKSSVSASTSMVVTPVPVYESMPPKLGLTSAHFVAIDPTMPSPGPAVPTLEDFLEVSLPPHLSYLTFTSIHHNPQFNPNLYAEPHIFTKIISPYDPDAFEHYLIKHNLDKSYPHLVSNLRYGFPLGDHMPDLTSTVIIPNPSSIFVHVKAIEAYLTEEITAGQMAGPFSAQQVEKILRGPFQSSPLVVSVQPQGPGEPDKDPHLSSPLKSHQAHTIG